MKKLLITLISIFVLINIAFAQSAIDKKVDSLKNEQAKAEQAKKLADDKLRQDLSDKNYQAAKTAREKMEKVNKELEVALSEQKAEQEAKAKAEAEAEAAAKKAEEDRLMALYKKRFPEFEFVEIEKADYDYRIESYIIARLREDPNWDFKSIKVYYETQAFERYNHQNYLVRDYKYIGVIEIESYLGKVDKIKKGFKDADHEDRWQREISEAIKKVMEYRRNPDKFYLAKKEKEGEEIYYEDPKYQDPKYQDPKYQEPKYQDAKIRMEKAFKSYYYGYTGRKDGNEIDLSGCNKIELYQLEIPKDKNYYRISGRYEGKDNVACYYYDVLILQPKQYFLIKCNNQIHWMSEGDYFLVHDPIYKDKYNRRALSEGRNVVQSMRNSDSHIEEFHNMYHGKLGHDDLLQRYNIVQVDLKSLQKLVKTFKLEYYTDEGVVLQKMQKDVEDQYYKSTGKKYDFSKIVDLECQAVAMSYKDIPADSCYYRKENKSDAYLNTFNKIKGSRVFFAKCINSKGQQDLLGDVYMYQSAFGVSCPDKLAGQKDTMKNLGQTYFLPLNQIKTFRLKNYMQ